MFYPYIFFVGVDLGVRAVTGKGSQGRGWDCTCAHFYILWAPYPHLQPPLTMLLNSNNREFYNDIVAKIIEYIKQYKYLDVVEADLFIGISSRKDDHAVDVLVDGVKYIDDDSFGIDYSEPVRSRREQFARDGIAEVEADPDRVPDRTGAIVIRPYSDSANLFATPRDLVELLNVLKFTVGACTNEPVPFSEQSARPMWLMPYRDMIETERRAMWFEKYHVIYIQRIVELLRTRGTFDLSGLDLVVYMSDRNMCAIMSDHKLNIEEEFYLVRVDRISYRDERSFLLEGGPYSAVVDSGDRMCVRLMLLDIMRISRMLEYIARADKNESERSLDVEAFEIDCLLKHESLRREALNDIIDIGMRVDRRRAALGRQSAESV